MPEGKISKKKASEIRPAKDAELDSFIHANRVSHIIYYHLAKQVNISSKLRSYIIHWLEDFPVQNEPEKSPKAKQEWLWWSIFYDAVESYGSLHLPRNVVERRLVELERATYSHQSAIERLEDRMELLAAEEHEEKEKEKPWPAFASEEFGKIIENSIGLEGTGEDKSLMLYHIMEIETLLGKLERKARATNREYEARLAASLRDICRIHEPSELSDKQIKCFTGSLQALIEGWGALNREKLKWIRGRLLEVGLTWLPVTEKAQKVIDEAKSSVK